MRSSFLLAWTAAVAPSFDVVGRAQAPQRPPASAAIGSMVATIPPSCQTAVAGGATYSHCGNTWYTSQMRGTSMTYIVVAPPS